MKKNCFLNKLHATFSQYLLFRILPASITSLFLVLCASSAALLKNELNYPAVSYSLCSEGNADSYMLSGARTVSATKPKQIRSHDFVVISALNSIPL